MAPNCPRPYLKVESWVYFYYWLYHHDSANWHHYQECKGVSVFSFCPWLWWHLLLLCHLSVCLTILNMGLAPPLCWPRPLSLCLSPPHPSTGIAVKCCHICFIAFLSAGSLPIRCHTGPLRASGEHGLVVSETDWQLLHALSTLVCFLWTHLPRSFAPGLLCLPSPLRGS